MTTTIPYMPGALISALPVFTRLLPTFTYDAGQHYCHPHFADEEASSERSSNLPSVTQQASGGAGPQAARAELARSPALLGTPRRMWAALGRSTLSPTWGMLSETAFSFLLPGSAYLSPHLHFPCFFLPGDVAPNMKP